MGRHTPAPFGLIGHMVHELDRAPLPRNAALQRRAWRRVRFKARSLLAWHSGALKRTLRSISSSRCSRLHGVKRQHATFHMGQTHT